MATFIDGGAAPPKYTRRMEPRLHDAEYRSHPPGPMEDVYRRTLAARLHDRFALQEVNYATGDHIAYYLAPESTAEIADNLVAWNIYSEPRRHKRAELARMLKPLKTRAQGLFDRVGDVGIESAAAAEDIFQRMVDTLSEYSGTSIAEAKRLVHDTYHQFRTRETKVAANATTDGGWPAALASMLRHAQTAEDRDREVGLMIAMVFNAMGTVGEDDEALYFTIKDDAVETVESMRAGKPGRRAESPEAIARQVIAGVKAALGGGELPNIEGATRAWENRRFELANQ